jgi:uncharacterized membrane protein YtjA (UPF0391 family)
VIGRRIIVLSWVALACFTVVAVTDALGLSGVDGVAAGVSLVLFLGSLPIWLYAFGLVLVRSTRGDDIAVGSWVFLTGSAPTDVRRHLLGATAACVVIAFATAWANPFSVLVPMFSLGMAALWGARHGTYPARPAPVAVKGGRR